MFHHTASFTAENTPRTKAEGAVRYRREKKELVKKGESHGIIIYGKNGDPIGWCQYGPREELPRMDHNRIYLDKVRSDDKKSFWRITCFVVDKNYRRKGVASAALNAVLESIKKKGGGLVEAYPVSKTDEGPGFMNKGRESMFAKAGFKTIMPLRTGRNETVLMRRTI